MYPGIQTYPFYGIKRPFPKGLCLDLLPTPLFAQRTNKSEDESMFSIFVHRDPSTSCRNFDIRKESKKDIHNNNPNSIHVWFIYHEKSTKCKYDISYME